MLLRPENNVTAALASLEGDTRFETVKDWLRASLQDLYKNSARTKDETLSRWMQGAAQAVDELLTKADEAPNVIRKSR